MLELANLVPCHVVSRRLDLCCCARRSAKKASQILLKLYFSNLSGIVKMIIDILKCTKFLRNVLFPIRGFAQKSVVTLSVPSRFAPRALLLFVIISKSFSYVSKSVCLQTFFRSMMGRGEHVTNQDIL